MACEAHERPGLRKILAHETGKPFVDHINETTPPRYCRDNAGIDFMVPAVFRSASPLEISGRPHNRVLCNRVIVRSMKKMCPVIDLRRHGLAVHDVSVAELKSDR